MTTPIKKLPSWVLDSRLTPEARAQGERDERNVAIVDERYEQAKRDASTYIDIGDGTGQAVTTHDRLRWPTANGEAPHIKPIRTVFGPQYTGGFHHFLHPEDMDAILKGFYCERCLERLPQGVVVLSCPTCEWPRHFLGYDTADFAGQTVRF